MPIRCEQSAALAKAKATGRHGYQIAADAHIDPTTLSRIVTGQHASHRLTREAIARAPDRDVDELFAEPGEADAATAA